MKRETKFRVITNNSPLGDKIAENAEPHERDVKLF